MYIMYIFMLLFKESTQIKKQALECQIHYKITISYLLCSREMGSCSSDCNPENGYLMVELPLAL